MRTMRRQQCATSSQLTPDAIWPSLSVRLPARIDAISTATAGDSNGGNQGELKTHPRL